MKRMIKAATPLNAFTAIIKNLCSDIYEAMNADSFNDVNDNITYDESDAEATKLFDSIMDIIQAQVPGDVDEFSGSIHRQFYSSDDIDFKGNFHFVLFETAGAPKSAFSHIADDIETAMMNMGWDTAECIRYDDAEGYSLDEELKPYDVELNVKKNVDLSAI